MYFTGCIHFGARYYMAALGRWGNVDPLAEHPAQIDKSPYAYAWNNPVNLTDPDGQCPDCWEFTKGYFRGYYRALGGSISGTWNAVTHPVQTAKGVYDAAVNYERTATGIVDAGKAKLDQLQNGDAGAKGEVVGEVVEIIAEIVATAGAAGVTAKGARTTRALDNVSDAAGVLRYSDDVLSKTDLFHNYPSNFDSHILSNGMKVTANDGSGYLMRGSINGKEGVYNVVAKDGVITHRDFVSKKQWDQRSESFGYNVDYDEIK